MRARAPVRSAGLQRWTSTYLTVFLFTTLDSSPLERHLERPSSVGYRTSAPECGCGPGEGGAVYSRARCGPRGWHQRVAPITTGTSTGVAPPTSVVHSCGVRPSACTGLTAFERNDGPDDRGSLAPSGSQTLLSRAGARPASSSRGVLASRDGTGGLGTSLWGRPAPGFARGTPWTLFTGLSPHKLRRARQAGSFTRFARPRRRSRQCPAI